MAFFSILVEQMAERWKRQFGERPRREPAMAGAMPGYRTFPAETVPLAGQRYRILPEGGVVPIKEGPSENESSQAEASPHYVDLFDDPHAQERPPSEPPYDVEEQFDKDPVIQNVLASERTGDRTPHLLSSRIMQSIIQIFTGLVRTGLAAISPRLRDEVEEFVLALDKKARATDNAADDVFVAILKLLTGVDTSQTV